VRLPDISITTWYRVVLGDGGSDHLLYLVGVMVAGGEV